MATQWTAGTVSGQVLTAATMNTIGAAWESYTPTLTQGVSVGKTVNYAKYCQIQKTVILQVLLTCTGSGLGGVISVSLPSGLVPVSSSAQRVIGSFFIHDSTTAFYVGLATGESPVKGYSYGTTNNMGAALPAITLVANDQVSIEVTYEVA
jgi:hypothetical protein